MAGHDQFVLTMFDLPFTQILKSIQWAVCVYLWGLHLVAVLIKGGLKTFFSARGVVFLHKARIIDRFLLNVTQRPRQNISAMQIKKLSTSIRNQCGRIEIDLR